MFASLSLLALLASSSLAFEFTPKLYASADVRSPSSAPYATIHAHFQFLGTLDGWPTFVKVRVLEGLFPTEELGGTKGFAYHVHTNPIDSDGNCTKALAHLDPYGVTESIICDPAFPEYCQEGDLAGKHGKLNGTSTGKIPAFGYSDAYLRFFPPEASLLGRSIVIHAANKTRLACGNITSELDNTADYFQQPTNSPSTFVSDYPSSPAANPPPTITPLVGTDFPNDTFLEGFAHALPLKAMSLEDALNVKLNTVQRTVRVTLENTTEVVEVQTTGVQDEKVEDQGPFKGWKDVTWT